MKWTFFGPGRFAEAASVWDSINSAASDLAILDSRTIACAIDHFSSGDELACIGHDALGPALGLVLRKQGMARWESFQPSQLPIGPTVTRPGLDIGQAVESLARALPGLCLSVGLTELDPLLTARPTPGQRLATSDFVETAWIDVDQAFEDYWSQRGKNLRQNVRKQTTKLESEGTPPKLISIEAPDAMAAAIAVYGELESAGWKGREGTAVSAGNVQGRFYTALFETLAASGQARVYQLWVGDKVVASDLCLERAGIHIVLKTAYDEAEKKFSPSTLLRFQAFESIFGTEAVRRVEFYGKRMEWHTRWTDNVRTLYHLTCYRGSAVRTIADLARRLKNEPANA